MKTVEYPDGLRVAWLDDETRRLFEQSSDDQIVNSAQPDTSQPYFLDLIGRIDDAVRIADDDH